MKSCSPDCPSHAVPAVHETLPQSPLVAHDLLKPSPGLIPSLYVRLRRLRSFSGSHEPVARALVRHRFVLLAGLFHLIHGGRNCGVDAGVVARVETVHRSFDPGHCILLRRSAVEHERRGKVRSIRCEPETLAAAITEAGDEQLLLRRWEF